jgi:D-sedoheptulose 7-phosphate isomerase
MGRHVRVSSAVRRHYEQVQEAGDRFFAAHAPELASACWGMARRFHSGGRLFVHGEAGASFSDAQHNAVEFIHPVLVGKRALPAVAVRDAGWLAAMAGPNDIRMQVRPTEMVVDGQVFHVDTEDPLVGQEILETAYHELWELVHVFFEHEGLLLNGGPGEDVCLTCGDVAVQGSLLTIDGSRGVVRTALGEEEVDVALIDAPRLGDLLLCHGGVAIDRVKPIDQFSQEFYPFLTNEAVDAATVLADVARSVLIKWEEVAAIRRATSLDAVEDALNTTSKPRVDAGATVLTFGNGGSATDAADLAADLQAIGVPALDLSGEPSVITAIGNDVGFEEVFARQVIALGRAADVAIGITTSGRSANALRALRQARKQGLATIALAGYGGGDLKREDSLAHLLVTESTYIPRIQEAQATIYHALVRGLGEDR